MRLDVLAVLLVALLVLGVILTRRYRSFRAPRIASTPIVRRGRNRGYRVSSWRSGYGRTRALLALVGMAYGVGGGYGGSTPSHATLVGLNADDHSGYARLGSTAARNNSPLNLSEVNATIARFKGRGPWHDVTHPDYGADPTGVADSYAAIQLAITTAATGETIFLPRGEYLISQTLIMSKNKQVLFGMAGGAMDSNSGSRLTWTGADGGKVLQVTAGGVAVVNIVVNASTDDTNPALDTADVCVEFEDGEYQQIARCRLNGGTGYGLVVGNGVANNNNFRAEGLLVNYGPGGAGVYINAQATENIKFSTLTVTSATNGNTPTRLVEIVNGHATMDELILDDGGLLNDYAIKVTAGSIGIGNLTGECNQILQMTAVGRNRGSYIDRGDIRSANPQAGQFAIDLRASGNERVSFGLGYLRIKNKAGALVVPQIQVAGVTVVNTGTWFEEEAASPGRGSFSYGATGHIVNFEYDSLTPNFVNFPLSLDAGSPLKLAATPTTAGQIGPSGSELQYHDGVAVRTIEKTSRKGAANGYASLDAATKVPVAELPNATTIARGVVLRAAAPTATDPAGALAAANANTLADAPAAYLEATMQTELDKLNANDNELRTKLNLAITALNEEIARRKDVEAKLVTAAVLT